MEPELRVFLSPTCVINPLPRTRAAKTVGAIAAIVVPKLIGLGLSAVSSRLKKAGETETKQITGAEFTSFYVTDVAQQLHVNPALGCIIGVYGRFVDEDKGRRRADDPVLASLVNANLVPQNTDLLIAFEAAIVPTPDRSAFYLEARHFAVRDFIGDRRKDERSYILTLSVTTPNAAVDGNTIALGHIDFGVMQRETAPIRSGQELGEYPRYRSNLMPWATITGEAKEAYDSAVQRNAAQNAPFMPVSFNLTISETADGNKFLAFLGELFDSSKEELASELSARVLPKSAESLKEAADAREQLYQAEEDAFIALKEAEANLAAGAAEQQDLLTAKLAKTKRALETARALRKAAGLPDLPGVGLALRHSKATRKRRRTGRSR